MGKKAHADIIIWLRNLKEYDELDFELSLITEQILNLGKSFSTRYQTKNHMTISSFQIPIIELIELIWASLCTNWGQVGNAGR